LRFICHSFPKRELGWRLVGGIFRFRLQSLKRNFPFGRNLHFNFICIFICVCVCCIFSFITFIISRLAPPLTIHAHFHRTTNKTLSFLISTGGCFGGGGVIFYSLEKSAKFYFYSLYKQLAKVRKICKIDERAGSENGRMDGGKPGEFLISQLHIDWGIPKLQRENCDAERKN